MYLPRFKNNNFIQAHIFRELNILNFLTARIPNTYRKPYNCSIIKNKLYYTSGNDSSRFSVQRNISSRFYMLLFSELEKKDSQYTQAANNKVKENMLKVFFLFLMFSSEIHFL